MARYETKKIMFLKSHLPKDIKVGDVRKYFGSQIKVKDIDYRNFDF